MKKLFAENGKLVARDSGPYTCPDCKCQFVQPFKCITCGAEKLYDTTVRQQAERIRHLEASTVILGEIAALVPLSETLAACKTGATLVDWLKAHLITNSGEGKP